MNKNLSERQKAEHRHAAEDEEARQRVFAALLQHDDGKVFLWWLLSIGRAIGSQPYTNNALATSFNCGQLDVGNQILAELIDSTDSGFADLMKEMHSVRRQRDAELAAARTDY